MIYRRLNHIPDEPGTAVNVQVMVYGNMGENCGTGVAFTRNPANGDRELYGEWLINAQGEDVVAGIRTPGPVHGNDGAALERRFPGCYGNLLEYARLLEKHFGDMQDVEFTIESEKLWMLQTRSGKRTGPASLTMAVDMLDEGLIDEATALLRVEPEQISQLLRPVFDPEARRQAGVLAKGLNAGPGAASGRIALTPEKAEQMAASGPVILVREETSADDIAGIHCATGILTARGGMTSHAALVTRQMGRVCVVGCEALHIDPDGANLELGGKALREGDEISLDGFTGEVLAGALPTRPSPVLHSLQQGGEHPDLEKWNRIMSIAQDKARLRVRANADQPEQARLARALGAEGIGLCRTEHMFFGKKKIDTFRRMILADDEIHRREALRQLEDLQEEDFYGLFREMQGKPVVIRLLDPPLHEFLPVHQEETEHLAEVLGISVGEVGSRCDQLRESNPMLGHRGCRLGITHPAITKMQVRALVRAARRADADGCRVKPEIMVPLVGTVRELVLQREAIAAVLDEFEGETPQVKTGTMIELPAAALNAAEIAGEAAFFSFGTNDLTQTTLGMSRDDCGSFLGDYQRLDIYRTNPFSSIDRPTVGRLVQMAVENGRRARPGLVTGICGEHGGDPASVAFFHEAGLDYVSCSPLRVPVAWLAAARAALLDGEN